MGILVKGEITITKGFKTWKEMVYAQDGKLKEHGIKFIFAGTQKDDPSKLHTVMQFPNMEALQAWSASMFGNCITVWSFDGSSFCVPAKINFIPCSFNFPS